MKTLPSKTNREHNLSQHNDEFQRWYDPKYGMFWHITVYSSGHAMRSPPPMLLVLDKVHFIEVFFNFSYHHMVCVSLFRGVKALAN